MSFILPPRKRPRVIRPSGVPVLNRASPLADGLAGWFDIQYGRVIDLTGNVKSADISVDDSSGDLSPFIGELGHGVNFSGGASDDRIDLGGIPATNPLNMGGRTEITVTAWARKDDDGNFDTFRRIIDKSDGGNAANGWGWWGNSNGQELTFGIDGTVPGVTVGMSNDGQWHHLCMIADIVGQTLSFYQDGIHITTRTGLSYPAIPSNTTNCAIGNWNHSTDRMWLGPIAVIGVWTRALTNAEVWALYDPATRWDLYWQPKIIVPVTKVGGAPAPGLRNLKLGSADVDNMMLGAAEISSVYSGSTLVWQRGVQKPEAPTNLVATPRP